MSFFCQNCSNFLRLESVSSLQGGSLGGGSAGLFLRPAGPTRPTVATKPQSGQPGEGPLQAAGPLRPINGTNNRPANSNRFPPSGRPTSGGPDLTLAAPPGALEFPSPKAPPLEAPGRLVGKESAERGRENQPPSGTSVEGPERWWPGGPAAWRGSKTQPASGDSAAGVPKAQRPRWSVGCGDGRAPASLSVQPLGEGPQHAPSEDPQFEVYMQMLMGVSTGEVSPLEPAAAAGGGDGRGGTVEPLFSGMAQRGTVSPLPAGAAAVPAAAVAAPLGAEKAMPPAGTAAVPSAGAVDMTRRLAEQCLCPITQVLFDSYGHIQAASGGDACLETSLTGICSLHTIQRPHVP